MDESRKQQLQKRNEALIALVKQKAERDCPGSIDLIALTGSFHSGNYYEKSDLDLLIVKGDNAGGKVSFCFILEGVAHDIYCHTWGNLEDMAAYRSPHVLKLLDVEILYTSSEVAAQRYQTLSTTLRNTLAQPFGTEYLAKVQDQYGCALKEFGALMLCQTPSECKFRSARVLNRLEFALYLLNKSYIAGGVKGIPQEICRLRVLPKHFKTLYFAAIEAKTIGSIREALTALMNAVGTLLRRTEEQLVSKTAISSDALRGSYEEIYSNWKNKMHYAAATDDKYLSLMTAASCQDFYDDMFHDYAIAHYNLFAGVDLDNLSKTAETFDAVMERYGELYANTGTPIRRYASLEELSQAYLGRS